MDGVAEVLGRFLLPVEYDLGITLIIGLFEVITDVELEVQLMELMGLRLRSIGCMLCGNIVFLFMNIKLVRSDLKVIVIVVSYLCYQLFK